MLLKKDLKWSPDGIQVRNIPAGEYEAGSLPERALEVAAQMGILEAVVSSEQQINAAEQPEPKKTKK